MMKDNTSVQLNTFGGLQKSSGTIVPDGRLAETIVSPKNAGTMVPELSE
jgi:hypothetical protein